MGTGSLFGKTRKLRGETKKKEMGKKFEKGNAGKPKGAENKTTKAAKELFISIMEGQVDKIETSLEEVYKKDPAKYLEVVSKFFPYFIPKKVEIDTPEGIKLTVTRKVVKA